MSHTDFHEFLKRFPGPYHFRPGRHGVDATFDVICEATGKFIYASHYWEAKEAAKDEAIVVTLALMAARQSHAGNVVAFLGSSLQKKLTSFLDQSPAPFEYRFEDHEFDPGFMVTSKRKKSTAAYVRLCHGSQEQSRIVAAAVSHALTQIAVMVA